VRGCVPLPLAVQVAGGQTSIADATHPPSPAFTVPSDCGKVFHMDCSASVPADCGLTTEMLAGAISTSNPNIARLQSPLSGGGSSPSMLPSPSTSSLTSTSGGSISRGTTGSIIKFFAGDSRLPPEVRMNGHIFELYDYLAPVFCVICSDMLWGIKKQGYKCLRTLRRCGQPTVVAHSKTYLAEDAAHARWSMQAATATCTSGASATCTATASRRHASVRVVPPDGTLRPVMSGTSDRRRPRRGERALCFPFPPVGSGSVIEPVRMSEVDSSETAKLRRGPSLGKQPKFNKENENKFSLTVRLPPDTCTVYAQLAQTHFSLVSPDTPIEWCGQGEGGAFSNVLRASLMVVPQILASTTSAVTPTTALASPTAGAAAEKETDNDDEKEVTSSHRRGARASPAVPLTRSSSPALCAHGEPGRLAATVAHGNHGGRDSSTRAH